jgi:asparagine synthase (glutamine-hydrolysing)
LRQNGRAFSAHTRLAIIDLSPAASQPMTTSDGRFTIVHNGEVFNFREIRKELGVRSEQVSGQHLTRGLTTHDSRLTTYDWRSNSDTEVILRAYERWGRDCVKRFAGMFAFAIWDGLERSLFLARDRMGIKPLYYAATSEGLAFSSEVRTILETGLSARRLSREGLASYLAFGSVSEPATIIDGIRSLPAGSVASFRAGELSIEPFWNLPEHESEEEIPARTTADLHALLEQSVRSNLVSDVPLGVFLSGGIDSSAIASLASSASDSPLNTFTVTFDEESHSEEEYAAQVAERFRCRHRSVHLSPSRAAAEFGEAAAALDQPSADGINTYFVAKATREAGLSVALSGLGGDEVFAGYRHFRSFPLLLRAGRAAGRLPGAPRSREDSFEGFNGVPNRFRKLREVLAAGGRPAATYSAVRSMFTAGQIRSLVSPGLFDGGIPSGASFVRPPSNGEGARHLDPVNLFSKFELQNYMLNTLLRDTDSMSMAHSLEVRVPLLEHALVERVFRLPGRLKLSRRTNKPLLVSAAGNLPREIADRPKMGFALPFDSWFRGPLKLRIEDVLLDESNSMNVLRPGSAARLWELFLGGRSVAWSRVWCVAALLNWCRQHEVIA